MRTSSVATAQQDFKTNYEISDLLQNKFINKIDLLPNVNENLKLPMHLKRNSFSQREIFGCYHCIGSIFQSAILISFIRS